ncbi:MAG: GNAT family N-acetyltransferase [Methanoregula sp.]
MIIPYTIDELNEQHFQNGFIETLSFLNEIDTISQEKLIETFIKLKQNADSTIFVAVTSEGKVVGTTTLLIEQKFIHNCGLVGHIEDVVVHEKFRGQKIADRLIEKAINVAREAGCYKVILDCNEKLVPFYQKLGFKKHEIGMRFELMKDC